MSVSATAGNAAPLSARRRARLRVFKLMMVVVAILFVEAFCGLFYKKLLSEPERAAVAPIRANAYSRAIQQPHPYTLITLSPGRSNDGYRQINDRGFRSSEVAMPKPPGRFRIFCLGGSTTYGTSVADPAKTYPAQLQAYLREKSGNPDIEVINAGISYACSFEVLSTFLYRVLPLEPDLVVVDASINDVEPLLMPEYAEDYTHWRQNWTAPSAPFWLRAALMSPTFSILYAKIAKPHTKAASYQKAKLNVHYLDKLDVSSEVLARKPTAYRRNLENLVLVAKGRGIKVMLANARNRDTQPHIERVYEMHREVTSDLSKTYGVAVCDFHSLGMRIPKSHFVNIRGGSDPNHLDAAGERMKAEIFGDTLLKSFPEALRRAAPE